MPSGMPGTLSANGLYTAPNSISSQQTVPITATTLGDSSKSISATVTLTPAITVSVTPGNITLNGGQTQQFTANVSNTSNTAVTWTINPAGAGTITSSGLFTAAPSVTTQFTMNVIATSQADPTQSASATITLSPTPISSTPSSSCGASGYSTQRIVVIDHTKVPNTDQTDFPFLFNTTDPDLATIANGGQVANSNGYDIIFSLDPNGLTKLDHELEEYNPSTGQVIAWVRIPNLSHTTNTVIYVFYGNPNIIASQQNPNGVWDSNYTAVYHLANTGTGTAADSTSYGNSGTLTSVSAASGKIDGAASFNGVSSYIQIPQADFPTYPTADSLSGTIPSGQPPFTASFGLWFKTASPGGLLAQMPDPDCNYLLVCIPDNYNPEPGDWDPPSNPILYVDDNGNLEADNGSIVTHAAYNDNNWHYAVITNASDGTGTVYVDGQNVASQPAGIPAYSPNYVYFVGTAYTWLSDLGNSSWLYFNGSIDEIRVSSISRSSDWIKTEYNNQGTPTTFYTFNPSSSVQVVPSAAILYGSQSQQFATTALCNTAVAWSMTAGTQGTLTSGGFYTAPASITTPQTVTITATNQATGTTIGSSLVTLLPPPLPITLSAAAQPPYTTGSSQALSATLKDQYGNAETGVTVTFIVSGVNNNIGSSTTDSNGIASYSYFGANNGNDSIQATAVVNGQLLASNSVSIFWTVPPPPNPAGSIVLKAPPMLGQAGLMGAFTDNNGAVIEPVAIGASQREFVVPAGATQLQLGVDSAYYALDGGPGFVVAVNGVPVPVPATAMPWIWVTGGLNNNYQYGIYAPNTQNVILDGTNPVIAPMGLTQGESVSIAYLSGMASTNYPLSPLVNADGEQTSITGVEQYQGTYFPTLYTTPSSYPVGQPISFNALVTDATGNPLPNIPVTLNVTGANVQQLLANTDSTGTATFMYSGLYEGTDSLLAEAFPSGQSGIVSGQASITWTNFPTPPPAGSLTFTDDRIYGPDNEQGFIVAATDASGSPVFDANVGFYVWGANNYSASGMTDVNGEVPFTFEHNPGAWNAVAVDSVGRNVVITNPLSGVWTPPTTSNPPGYEITVGISALNTVTMPNILRLNGTATDNLGNTLTATWSQVSGPGTITFTPTQQQVTNGPVVANASFSDAGSYVLQLTASDGLGSSASTQTTVTATPPLRNPQGWIGSPVYGSTVTGIVPITLASGVTLQPGGVLTYYPATNSSNNTTLPITAESGTISTLDTTVLPNGSYWIQLQATDTNGDQQYSLVLVSVAGNYKPGRVTATVTDLVVPATGLAINIQRTYDSFNAGTSGDFGYGWNLGINVNLVVDNVGNVTFTLGGQRKTFNLTPAMPPCSGLVCLFPYYFVAYTPEPGLHGTLNDGGQACPFDIVVPDGSLWYCDGGGQYTPTSYIYTDPNGTSYTISAAGNLQSMQDRSGNGLTITPTGITSSSGLSVPFVRDASNRITQITDPQGNIYQYAYDGSGNLASVTYPPATQTTALCPNTTQPNTSTYTYDSNHLYTGGTDALCHVLPTTAYYPSGTLDTNGNSLSGRLQSVTDALGETTSYAYNLATNTTAVTYPLDANGNPSSAVMTYDGYGMLLSTKDPLGLITSNVYDVNHNLISVTDPLGHTNSYTYDSNGNKTSSTYPNITQGVNTTSYTAYNQYSEPTSTTDELGNVRTFNYDASYNPQSVTDTINGAPATLASFIFNANGTLQAGAIGYDITAQPTAASQFSYDANGNMTGRIDALGRFTSYTYDSLGNKLTTTLPLPNSGTSATAATTTYTYDAFGHLTQTAAPLGRITGSTYDANGNKITDTDARGNVTSYQYDALNRLTITTYPTIPVTTSTRSYDFRNNLIDETDQAGHITHHVYDLSGRQTSITKGYNTPQASATSFTYYDDGRKYTETDALNHTTTYIYDAAGRLTSIAGPKGNFTYAYDAAGNRISSADGNGNTTTFQYDARKRLVKTVYPDRTSATNSYDGPGNLASVTDAAGAVVRYTYDPANQLQTVVQLNHPNPSNNTNTYGYDPLGNLTALTDENLHTTQNVFDLFNEPVSKTLPDQTLTETRQYDAAGNLVSLTHFNGVTTTYTYDAQNRKLTQSTPGEPTISFTYTATGKYLTSAAGDGTVNYSYDPLDRLTTKATPEGTLSYTYYANGNVETIASSNPNGVSVTLTWDELDRLSTVVDNRLPAGANTAVYTYDPAGNVATATYPNGFQTTFTYDQLSRINAVSTPVSSYTYQLGPTGIRTGATEGNGRSLTWNYDGIYRLTNETVSNDPANNGSASYGLDPVGNRLSAVSSLTSIASGSFSYNPDDEISSESYDANGNVLSAGGVVYTYDSENHMTSATGNGKVVTMVYDAFGNRVSKTVNGVTTQYLVEDDVNPTGLPQVVEELVNGTVTRQYMYGLQRISENQLIANVWTPSFYGYDGGGSVRQLTNSVGVVTDTYEYDAFGNSFTKSGTTPNNYLYRGEQFDADLGLYYLRARYYNPFTGRFMSRDPEDGKPCDPKTLHKYLYAGGDPVNGIDPRGRADEAEAEEMFIISGDTLETELELRATAAQVRMELCIEALMLEIGTTRWPMLGEEYMWYEEECLASM